MANLIDITDMDDAQLAQLLAAARRGERYRRAREHEQYLREARAAERPLVWRPGELAILLEVEASAAALACCEREQRTRDALGQQDMTVKQNQKYLQSGRMVLSSRCG